MILSLSQSPHRGFFSVKIAFTSARNVGQRMQSPLNASNRKVVLASTACGAAGGAARSRFGRDAPIGTPGPISKMSARKLVSEAIQTVTECSGTALLADGGLDALALHRLGDAAATLTRAAGAEALDGTRRQLHVSLTSVPRVP